MHTKGLKVRIVFEGNSACRFSAGCGRLSRDQINYPSGANLTRSGPTR